MVTTAVVSSRLRAAAATGTWLVVAPAVSYWIALVVQRAFTDSVIGTTYAGATITISNCFRSLRRELGQDSDEE
jgi:hypothetical protein